MRSAAAYSTWWNGGMRTATYFRNQIGILTEIIGNPTPVNITLVAEKQLAKSDWPMPIGAAPFPVPRSHRVHDRGRARRRSTTPRAIARPCSTTCTSWAAGRSRKAARRRLDGHSQAHRGAQGSRPAPARSRYFRPAELPATPSVRHVVIDSALYAKVLRDPAFRDPRGYIITADQADFPTAVKFIQVLLKGRHRGPQGHRRLHREWQDPIRRVHMS
jgi:hypothetical protein